MYFAVKHLHMLCALLSISGFILRGFWMFTNSPMREKHWVKTLPHIIDTLLLASAITLTFLIQQYPFIDTWVTVKIFALLTYIALGLVALRFGKNKIQQSGAFLLAVLTFCYIVLLARSHNPLFFMS